MKCLLLGAGKTTIECLKALVKLKKNVSICINKEELSKIKEYYVLIDEVYVFEDFHKIDFKKYDYIIGPTTTTTAYDLTDPMDDPLKSFMDDVLVIPVNMAGLPGLNLPIGFDNNHMPIGMQIIGDEFDEVTIYKLASFIEKKLNLDLDPRGDKHE